MTCRNSNTTWGSRVSSLTTHLLQRVDVSVLSEYLVLIETLFGSMPLLQLHTQRQVERYDRLVEIVLVLTMSAHAQHLVQCVQRIILLVHLYKLLGSFEGIFRVLKIHHPTLNSKLVKLIKQHNSTNLEQQLFHDNIILVILTTPILTFKFVI